MGICETIKMITREEGTAIGREEEKMDFEIHFVRY